MMKSITRALSLVSALALVGFAATPADALTKHHHHHATKSAAAPAHHRGHHKALGAAKKGVAAKGHGRGHAKARAHGRHKKHEAEVIPHPHERHASLCQTVTVKRRVVEHCRG
jgi:hypothetical protein